MDGIWGAQPSTESILWEASWKWKLFFLQHKGYYLPVPECKVDTMAAASWIRLPKHIISVLHNCIWTEPRIRAILCSEVKVLCSVVFLCTGASMIFFPSISHIYLSLFPDWFRHILQVFSKVFSRRSCLLIVGVRRVNFFTFIDCMHF